MNMKNKAKRPRPLGDMPMIQPTSSGMLRTPLPAAMMSNRSGPTATSAAAAGAKPPSMASVSSSKTACHVGQAMRWSDLPGMGWITLLSVLSLVVVAGLFRWISVMTQRRYSPMLLDRVRALVHEAQQLSHEQGETALKLGRQDVAQRYVAATAAVIKLHDARMLMRDDDIQRLMHVDPVHVVEEAEAYQRDMYQQLLAAP